MRDIIKITNSKISLKKLPSLSDIEEVKFKTFVEKVKAVIEEGHLTKYINLSESMISEDYSALDISAALMKIHLSDNNSTDEDIDLESSASYSGGRDRGDKGDRSNRNYKGDREDKPRNKERYKDENMVKLTINVGKSHKVRTKDIVGTLAGETGVPGKSIGAIEIMEDCSYVDVNKEHVKDILLGMKDKKIKGVRVTIDRLKKDKKK